MWIVHRILKHRYWGAALITQPDMRRIAIWFVLEHACLGDNALHFLQDSPAPEHASAACPIIYM